MEAAAKMFERKEEIHRKVELQLECEPYLWMQNIISSTKQKYIPYCEVSMELHIRLLSEIKISIPSALFPQHFTTVCLYQDSIILLI